MTHARQKLGRQGEELAVTFLTERGYQILERNWRCLKGEVDIIATHEEFIIFCEVKTLAKIGVLHPVLKVNHTKQRHLQESGLSYLASHEEIQRQIRFDIITIIFKTASAPEVEHWINAF